MSKNTSWPSIGTISNWLLNTADSRPNCRVRSKIKVHGTNCSIVFRNGEAPVARKRGGKCKNDEDNFGFQGWMKQSFPNKIDVDTPFILFGEWAGEGINSHDRDAVTKLDFRAFFVFSVLADDQWHIEPEVLERFVASVNPDPVAKLIVLPWFDELKELDLLDYTSLQAFADSKRREVDQIGEQCPFILSRFNRSGPGEGLVFYDVDTKAPIFKIKSAHHAERVSQGSHESIHVPVFDDVKSMAEEFFTEKRMQQVIHKHCDGMFNRKTFGRFMKEIIEEVIREGENEIEVSSVNFADVRAYGSNIARDWFALQEVKTGEGGS